MNWIQKSFRHPTPIGGNIKSPTIWDIGVPDPITGSDITTEYGDYIPLDPPMDVLSGYVIVPGMRLHSPNGIGLRGAVELWDDDELIHEEDIATISASNPVSVTLYGLPEASVDDYRSSGTHVGSWAALTTPIPAGSGYLCGNSTGGSAGSLVGLRTFPFTADYGMDVICRLEFGDADGNVLVSVDMTNSSFQCNKTATSVSNVQSLVNAFHPISWGAPIAKERCVAVVSGFYGTQDPYGDSGLSENISVMRIE
jgi:hypothetical protein